MAALGCPFPHLGLLSVQSRLSARLNACRRRIGCGCADLPRADLHERVLTSGFEEGQKRGTSPLFFRALKSYQKREKVYSKCLYAPSKKVKNVYHSAIHFLKKKKNVYTMYSRKGDDIHAHKGLKNPETILLCRIPPPCGWTGLLMPIQKKGETPLPPSYKNKFS